MGNLNYKDRPLLITNLTVADIGLFLSTDPDTAVTQQILQIKKIGLPIPYDASCKIQKSCTQDGAVKSVLLSLDCPTNQSLVNYDYGFDVIKKVKNPGVLNDDWAKKARFYGGTIKSLQVPSGGFIADSDRITAETDIITQIKNDRGFGSREESIIDSRRVYIVSTVVLTDNSIKYTLADGTTQTLQMGATMAAALIAFNANTGGLIAFAKSSTQMVITSAVAGVIFTIEDGAGIGPIVIEGRYIWIYSRDINTQFELQFNTGDYSITRFNVVKFLNGYTAGTTMFAVNGTKSAALATSATSSAFVTTINASGVNAYIYASTVAAGANKDVYVYSGIYELKIPSMATGLTINQRYSGLGVYPNLQWDDVFREFAEAKHLGELTHITPLNQPTAGDKYCKVIISWELKHATMHGASQQDTQLVKQTIYIKQGAGASTLWHDPATAGNSGMWETIADNAAFSATKTINDLISTWSGAAITPAIL